MSMDYRRVDIGGGTTRGGSVRVGRGVPHLRAAVPPISVQPHPPASDQALTPKWRPVD